MIELDQDKLPRSRLLVFLLFFCIPALVVGLPFSLLAYVSISLGNGFRSPDEAVPEALWAALWVGLHCGFYPWFAAISVDRPALLVGGALCFVAEMVVFYSPFCTGWFDYVLLLGWYIVMAGFLALIVTICTMCLRCYVEGTLARRSP
jgi:hypothetical protein